MSIQCLWYGLLMVQKRSMCAKVHGSVQRWTEVNRGEDCMNRFCESLGEHAMKIINFKSKKMIVLESMEYESYLNQVNCHIWKKIFRIICKYDIRCSPMTKIYTCHQLIFLSNAFPFIIKMRGFRYFSRSWAWALRVRMKSQQLASWNQVTCFARFFSEMLIWPGFRVKAPELIMQMLISVGSRSGLTWRSKICFAHFAYPEADLGTRQIPLFAYPSLKLREDI